MLCGPHRVRWLSHVSAPHPALPQSFVGQEPLLASVESLLQSLKDSSALGDIRRLHCHILRCGLEQTLVLGNALMQMYGRYALPDDVYACFKGLHRRNHISWNLVIRACAYHAPLAHDAFRLFASMQRDNVAPTKFIFASILSACCTPDSIIQGRLIHCFIACQACESDVVVGTALVSMYRKCRSLEDAYATFRDLPERNVVCWNVMIALNAELDCASSSLSLLKEMEQHAVIPEKATFLIAFKACACVANVFEAKRLHACVKCSEFASNLMVMTALMKMYGTLDSMSDAQRIFEKMPERDLVSWNALIAIYAQQSHGEAAIQIFKQMQLERVQPNRVTLLSVLDACASQSAGFLGKGIHNYIIGAGYDLDVVLGTSLVNMYGSCVSLEDAWHVLNSMPERNIVSWNAMMAVCVHKGDAHMVLQLFEHVQQDGMFPDNVTFLNVSDACAIVPDLAKGKQIHARLVATDFDLDVILGSSLINMYGACSDLRGARLVFDRMTEHNTITFTNLLSVCADLGALAEGKWLHAFILEKEVEMDVIINTALVNMYGKCGMLDIAWNIFLNMPERNTMSWNAMIAAYTQQGQGKRAIEVFDVMRQSGIIPDETTFVSVFCACSHTGLVYEGCCFFLLMLRVYGIGPIVDHYNCLLDMLGRAGRLDEAEIIIKNMPLWPTRVSWSTLLGACQNQVDVERGAMVANHIFGLNPKNSTVYVTLANMYAAAGPEDDAASVLCSITEKGSDKQLS
eukprot:c20062_g1_i1 orf=121-2349(+)